jgi:hypothetical protein
MSQEAAELTARALFPLDTSSEGQTVSRRFPKRIARRTKRFRKAAQSKPHDVVVDLAYQTIEDYFDIAVSYGEPYYMDMFEELTAHPAPWAGHIGSEAGQEPMMDKEER